MLVLSGGLCLTLALSLLQTQCAMDIKNIQQLYEVVEVDALLRSDLRAYIATKFISIHVCVFI